MELKKNFFIALLLTFTLVACKHDPLKVDTDGVEVEVDFVHLDSILFYTAQSDLILAKGQLMRTIPDLFDYQIGYVLNTVREPDTTFVNSIMQYRSDEAIQVLEKEIKNEFTDLSGEKRKLVEALKYLKSHLHNAPIPKNIVFQNSLFLSGAFCTEQEIGIGLERYLGPKSESVKRLNSMHYPDWVKNEFDRKYIERDAILSWILTHILPEERGNLAQQMIYYGKSIMLLEAAFPNESKELIMRYSAADYQWALKNEYSFWKYLVDEKMLFKTDERNAVNFFNEAPFTAGLPEVGPDRMGQFLGWRIVRNFMVKSKVSFQELLETPYTEILQNYEPE